VLGLPVAKVEEFTKNQKRVKFLTSSEVEITPESLPQETEIWVLQYAN